jgi:transglutaminase-like putative cysteine protease
MHRALFVALVVTLVAHAGPPLWASGFLRGATVVALSGLPGDVESEQAYADQLARLTQVTTAAGATLVQVEPASRERFLALGREVAAKSGPLVVFVWGHGGFQGTRPVFHVRGPRIEPADFADFATASGDRASFWVLYFRGSGAFARALAGKGRQILSSDDEKAFQSDPIGLHAMLDGLRHDPALPFLDLAALVGRATARWYDEQQLARTEEPTLWTDALPVHLATTHDAGAPQPGGHPGGHSRDPQATPVQADWAGVERVAPERFPGAKAVVLRRQDRYVIGESPALAQDTDEFIQVLDAEGESLADFDLSFWPPEERLSVLDCEVLHPDGTLVRLGPDDIHDAPGSGGTPEYPVAPRRAFSLPGVGPGAVFRVHTRREWRRFPLPHVVLEIPLAGELPILSASIDVQVDADRPLHYAVSGGGAPLAEPDLSRSALGRRFSWRIGETAAVPNEVLAPPNREPRLLVSTFPDWASFADWYGRLIRLADQVTPEIEAQAAALVRGKSSEREKVLALYDYVTSLRYVAVPLGVNSHRPHAAANVLRNRYGDCKDKANLFNTLLKTQGIPAHLVLVPRFGEAHAETPGLGFNHAISRVRVDGEWLFADTTDPFVRFGLLPPGDSGRNALVVDGESIGLVRLPDPRPEEHGLVLRGSVGADGQSRLELSARGFADYALRLLARQTAAEATHPILTEAYSPTTGLFAVERQSATAVSSLDRGFEWRAEGFFSALTAEAGGPRRLVRAPFWLPAEWASSLHARKTPLYLNQGYPLALEQRLELTLPPGAAQVALPSSAGSDEPPLRYHVEWSRSGGEQVVAFLRLTVMRGELTSEESTAFTRQLRQLLVILAQGALYEAPAPSR